MAQQREMNFNELTKSIESVKQTALQQRGHTFKYEIWVKNPMLSPDLMQVGSGSNNTTKGDVVDQFLADFDNVVAMDNVVYIKVIMKSKGKIIAQPEIIFKPEYANVPAAFPSQQVKSEPAKALGNTEPINNGQTPNTLQKMAIVNMLGCEELTQGVVFDEQDGGMSGMLVVRDRIHDMIRRKNELEKENTELQGKNTELKQQLDEAAKEKEEHATALNGFEDEMDSLKEELAEAKEKAEKSATLGGLLGNALMSLLPPVSRKLQASGKLPMLSGVFEALAADDEPQQQQQVTAANEPRADQYNEFMKYARTLNDEDFAKLWKVICKCAANKAVCDEILGTQPATAVNGDEAEEVEPEDVE